MGFLGHFQIIRVDTFYNIVNLFLTSIFLVAKKTVLKVLDS